MGFVYVYKNDAGSIGYVGIVKEPFMWSLRSRAYTHTKDAWYKDYSHLFYLPVASHADADALETLLIAKYDNGRYPGDVLYNKQKTGWGRSELAGFLDLDSLPFVEYEEEPLPPNYKLKPDNIWRYKQVCDGCGKRLRSHTSVSLSLFTKDLSANYGNLCPACFKKCQPHINAIQSYLRKCPELNETSGGVI